MFGNVKILAEWFINCEIFDICLSDENFKFNFYLFRVMWDRFTRIPLNVYTYLYIVILHILHMWKTLSHYHIIYDTSRAKFNNNKIYIQPYVKVVRTYDVRMLRYSWFIYARICRMLYLDTSKYLTMRYDIMRQNTERVFWCSRLMTMYIRKDNVMFKGMKWINLNKI